VDAEGWAEFLKSLRVEGKLHPCSSADLDAYERETGFKLPASYRTFCQVFGPGGVGDWFEIAVPGFTGSSKDKWNWDLSAANEFYHKGFEREEASPDPEQFKRSIIFARDCTAAVFFWDPKELTVRKKHEYGIYAMWRDTSLERVCDTFADFVKICLHRGDRTLYEDVSAIGFRPVWFGRGK
jgi:hypothetical protein